MKPADWAAWMALVALLPLVVVLFSSYVKIAVVLSVLRGAFGRAIPGSVAAAVALLLAGFVMAPVAERSWQAAGSLGSADAMALGRALARAGEPVRDFLSHHTDRAARRSFLELQQRLRPPEERASVGENDFLVLAPSFVLGELKAAFQVGFLLLLPFLVLELLVASLLVALGMEALDPRRVALPFKLLLFVLADGWHLLARGLVSSYG